jgi:hypothetical protein
MNCPAPMAICKHVAPLDIGPGPLTASVAGFAACPSCENERLHALLQRIAEYRAGPEGSFEYVARKLARQASASSAGPKS